jgi:formate/nitrite transporter FocA (FNT family)
MVESDDSAVPLDEDEKERAAEEESLNAATTHEVVRREGKKELERTTSALAWSGVAAGCSMGLSFVTQGVLHDALPPSAWRHLIVSAGYPLGFIAVILGSQQLFTENTLTPIVPFMTRPEARTFGKVMKLWVTVLVANLVGTWLFAEAIAHGHVLSAAVGESLDTLASGALAPSAPALFVRAIASGWMIALMVWMLPAASGSTPFVVFLMTWLIGAAELPHVIAGAVEVFFAAARGSASWAAALAHYIGPVLVGNLVGGVTLVSAVNHAQVVTDRASPAR